MPQLARILLFPIKSMEPVEILSARVVKPGALEHDRVLGLFDAGGKFVNGKRAPAVHQMRMRFDPLLRSVTVSRRRHGVEHQFHLDRELDALQDWLAEHFGFDVRVKENAGGGWPDDTDSPGPTLIGQSTLSEVAGWFEGLSAADTRLRFRTNLEINSDEPFWEDRLYGASGTTRRFRIGEVVLEGVNPCQRCAVPPRDPATGEAYRDFSVTFRERRQATLPSWADASRFDHFYRLAINTRIPSEQCGKTIRVGDELTLL